MLSELEKQWLNVCNHLFETLRHWDIFDRPLTRYNLHKIEYKHIKDFSGLQSQMVIDVIKDSFAVFSNNGGNIKIPSISYNIPRSGSFKSTKKSNPVVAVASLDKRIGLPISQDGAWNRFKDFLRNGWKTTSFRLKRNGNRWQLLMSIFKDFKVNKRYDAVVGVDVGSRTLAAISILNREGKILRQLYFGRDIWEKQRNISIRRSKLNSLADKGNYKARRKLSKLMSYESNFVKTRCYEVANRIIDLAKEYNAFIAIEDLKGLKNSRLHRKANRRVKRMPFYLFRVALEQVAGQNSTAVVTIDPAYTSQRCNRCGEFHETTSVLFKCPSCGFVCNRDRNASVNIAFVAGGLFKTMHTKTQINKRYVPVNGHVWQDDGCLITCSQHFQTPDCKPPISTSG